MDFDVLIKLLNDKINFLNKNIRNDENEIVKIGMFQEVIRKIKDDPYILYTASGDEYVSLLGFNESEKAVLEKCKIIYEGYLTFGREAMPQISIVEETTKKISVDLERKVCFLSDVIAKRQADILVRDSYISLSEEVNGADTYITQIDTLIDFLDSTNIPEEEKNQIKMSVVQRNNSIYHQRKEELEKAKVQEEKEEEKRDSFELTKTIYSKEIEEIKNILENKFQPEALKQLVSLSGLLRECKNYEDLVNFLSGWEHSFSTSFDDVVDGLIALKKIEVLEYKDNFGDKDEEVKNEIAVINDQISLLSIYKEHQKLEREADEVDISTDMNEYEKAISEYNPDPLATPNRVLFLNKGVGRNIADISDEETLKDVFLLIEQFRKDTIRGKDFHGYDGVRELKPSKKGRQARVRYVNLSNNVFVVLQVIGKKTNRDIKASKSLSERLSMFSSMKRNGEFPIDDLVEITKESYEDLYEKVSDLTTKKVGGVS